MKSVLRLASGALFLMGAGAAMAGEAPEIAVQPNAPGWMTIYYTHSGDGGALWFYIERQGAGVLFSSQAPAFQLTDANLKPDTEYAYRACAVYEGEDEPACSSFTSKRTPHSYGKPAGFDPPAVDKVSIDYRKIAISWGPTGDYSKVLLRLDDDRGNLGQWEVGAKPGGYGSYTFQPLEPDTTYHVILKGCTWGLFGSSCGPWSMRYDFHTFPLPEPPLPPGKPALTITSTTASTVSLAWTVKVKDSYPGDRAMLYRDGKPFTELEARSALGGVQGDYTESVQERHAYQVCYERDVISARVCSDRVLDPLVRSRGEAEIVTSHTKRFKDRAQSEIDAGATIGAAAFCANYADEAIAAAADNAARKCGGTGARWTSDRAAHLEWCEGLGDEGPARGEAAARADVLAKCVSPNLSGAKIKRF